MARRFPELRRRRQTTRRRSTGLGASASNGTLILIDGHRLPLSGINHTLADPSVIAPLAIERVEILPDGASAVYGSDAVAGVLNFITRRNYDGFEGNLQASFGRQLQHAERRLHRRPERTSRLGDVHVQLFDARHAYWRRTPVHGRGSHARRAAAISRTSTAVPRASVLRPVNRAQV